MVSAGHGVGLANMLARKVRHRHNRAARAREELSVCHGIWHGNSLILLLLELRSVDLTFDAFEISVRCLSKSVVGMMSFEIRTFVLSKIVFAVL